MGQARHFRRTSLIAIFCAAVLAGLGLSRRISFSPDWWLIIALPFALALRKRNVISLYIAIIIGLGLGLARGTVYMGNVHELQNLAGKKVSVIATASTDAIYDNKQQLSFDAKGVHLEATSQKLAGNFGVSGFGIPMVYRGDQLEISGKLYPARGSKQAYISFAQFSLVKPSTSWVDKFTRNFGAGMRNALPEPQASFGLGLLIGQRSGLGQEVLAQLTAVGLIHIVAVSGYNVTILSRAVARLKMGSRYQRLVLSLVLIAVFVLVTGFSASIVRAAIVSVLGLLAWYWGRSIRPIVLIAVAAAATALANPFYVWGNLGWYLSFLAFFGVLVVAPLIQARLFSKRPKLITTVLIETLSAELMTLPLILTYFNQLSIVAPLANLLVVPLVPLAMLLSAMAGLVGMVAPVVSGWFAWPAQVLLTYLLDIAHLLSNIKTAFIKVSASPRSMIIFYVIVLAVTISMRRAVRGPRGVDITP